MSRYFMVVICLSFSVNAIATDGHRFLPEHSGLPQGGVILRYPDAAEPIANTMGNILNEHGWAVLLELNYPKSSRVIFNVAQKLPSLFLNRNYSNV